jgi:hypothetical protein
MLNTETIYMLKVECNIDEKALEQFSTTDVNERPPVGLGLSTFVNLQISDNLQAAVATMTTDVATNPSPILKGKFILRGEYSIHGADGLKQEDVYKAFEREKITDLFKEMIKKINDIGETMACPFLVLPVEIDAPFST